VEVCDVKGRIRAAIRTRKFRVAVSFVIAGSLTALCSYLPEVWQAPCHAAAKVIRILATAVGLPL